MSMQEIVFRTKQSLVFYVVGNIDKREAFVRILVRTKTHTLTFSESGLCKAKCIISLEIAMLFYSFFDNIKLLYEKKGTRFFLFLLFWWVIRGSNSDPLRLIIFSYNFF